MTNLEKKMAELNAGKEATKVNGLVSTSIIYSTEEPNADMINRARMYTLFDDLNKLEYDYENTPLSDIPVLRKILNDGFYIGDDSYELGCNEDGLGFYIDLTNKTYNTIGASVEISEKMYNYIINELNNNKRFSDIEFTVRRNSLMKELLSDVSEDRLSRCGYYSTKEDLIALFDDLEEHLCGFEDEDGEWLDLTDYLETSVNFGRYIDGENVRIRLSYGLCGSSDLYVDTYYGLIGWNLNPAVSIKMSDFIKSELIRQFDEYGFEDDINIYEFN